MFQTWREPAGGGPRQFADMSVPNGAANTYFPTANFNDQEIEIRALTGGEVLDKTGVALKGRGSYWESTAANGKRLRVAR